MTWNDRVNERVREHVRMDFGRDTLRIRVFIIMHEAVGHGWWHKPETGGRQQIQRNPPESRIWLVIAHDDRLSSAGPPRRR